MRNLSLVFRCMPKHGTYSTVQKSSVRATFTSYVIWALFLGACWNAGRIPLSGRVLSALLLLHAEPAPTSGQLPRWTQISVHSTWLPAETKVFKKKKIYYLFLSFCVTRYTVRTQYTNLAIVANQRSNKYRYCIWPRANTIKYSLCTGTVPVPVLYGKNQVPQKEQAR
jgi:hypothetical protein